ncbi:MAG: aminopeptidase N [Deltaproteobacteria bacterium]|nr:aminopeptidase N [Deltaproteobacteria bacterium]
MNNHNESETIYLKDYQPPAFEVVDLTLHFSLARKRTLVTSKMELRRAPQTPADQPLQLDGRRLELLRIELDGRQLSPKAYTLAPRQLTIANPPAGFTLEIVTAINPESNTSLEGLYASNDLLCTQCEAHGFSRITYFPDRPDVLTRFTTTIEADKNEFPVLLSNGNLIAQGELPGQRHFTVWRDPFKKPAYLFALVAGRLTTLKDSFTTKTQRQVEIHFHVEEQNRHKCAHAVKALKKAMSWDEKEYDLEYDLDLYQVVAVNDFNFGAMENKGLNIFNAKYVLARPESATDNDYEAIESVIAHEYLHNWTGNRVTCRDWFQLSLKEGLTVFRDQQYGAWAFPGGGRRIREVRRLRSFQFPEDAGPLAHPVQPKEYIEINNFYTTTIYEKGAEIIGMLATLLGPENFRRGLRLYLQRHDGQAATIENLLAAMAEAGDRDLRQFRRWYDQAGTPTLTIRRRWLPDQAELQLTVEQQTPATPGQSANLPLHLPLAVALLFPDPPTTSSPAAAERQTTAGGTRILEIRKPKEVFHFPDCPRKPLLSLLRGFSAPVKIIADYNDNELAQLTLCDQDPFSRWEAAQQLAIKAILQRINGVQAQDAETEPLFSQTFGALLKRTWPDTEADSIAELLTLPDEIHLAEQLAVIDPQKICRARQHLKTRLARDWEKELHKLYHLHQSRKPYQPLPEEMAQRRLKNLALDYLGALGADTGTAWTLCRDQFRLADNLTDRLAALSGLLEMSSEDEPAELDQFFEQCRPDPLLLDRWFALQAACRRETTLNRVMRLVKHPEFHRHTPNRVRALLGGFCGNQAAFHQQDGSGYRLLATEIATLDQLNPQVAARLAGSFSRWRRFAAPYAQMMRLELKNLADNPELSRDLREIVDKSLAERQ